MPERRLAEMLPRRQNEVPDNRSGTSSRKSNHLGIRLGRASLSRLVVFFVLALAASLFLLILLTGLALLALTGLAALLAGPTGLSTLLSRLTTLTTLLSVFLHIGCHEIVLL